MRFISESISHGVSERFFVRHLSEGDAAPPA
jgi:hypothetical protein